jgi:hypothetical protein
MFFNRGNIICTTVICTNAKKMEKTGLCSTTFRGDVISNDGVYQPYSIHVHVFFSRGGGGQPYQGGGG